MQLPTVRGAPSQHRHPGTRSVCPTVCFVEDAIGDEAIERFLSSDIHTTLYHSPAWSQALAYAGIGRPLYLTACVGPEVVGVLPLLETDGRLRSKRITGLPASPVGDVLAHDRTARWALVSSALRMAARRGVDRIRVRSFGAMPGPSMADSVVLDWCRMPVSLARWISGQTSQERAAGLRAVVVDRCPRGIPIRSGTGIPNDVLRFLASHPRASLYGAMRTSDHGSRWLGLWIASGRHLHVLWLANCGTEVAPVLRLALQVSGDGGISDVDLPGLPPGLLNRMSVDAGTAMRFTVERTLTLTDCRTL